MWGHFWSSSSSQYSDFASLTHTTTAKLTTGKRENEQAAHEKEKGKWMVLPSLRAAAAAAVANHLPSLLLLPGPSPPQPTTAIDTKIVSFWQHNQALESIWRLWKCWEQLAILGCCCCCNKRVSEWVSVTRRRCWFYYLFPVVVVVFSFSTINFVELEEIVRKISLFLLLTELLEKKK